MAEHRFALFAAPIGRCAIVWGERGIVAVRLPERRESETRARILKRWPHAREALPPQPVQDALERIVALLEGEAIDLSSIALDLEGVPDFDREVYGVARKPQSGVRGVRAIAADFLEPGSLRAALAGVDPTLRHLPFVPLAQMLGYLLVAAAPDEDEPAAIEEHDSDARAVI